MILDIISYFKLLDNYHEGLAVYRILNLPFLSIPDSEIANITLYGSKHTKSLFESLQESSLIPGLSLKTKEKISKILSLIKSHSQLAREKNVSEIFISFLDDFGYLKYLTKANEKEKIELVNQFYKKIKTFEEATLEPSLKNFMVELGMELESGEEGKLEFDPDRGPDMIKVMTIHGAKGLEFKHIFLVSMVDKRFPSIERREAIELPDALIKDIKPKGEAHLQEERRLCYVAMTRAKEGLYFTSAGDYGGQRKKKISRFLQELGYRDVTELGDNKFYNIIPQKENKDRVVINNKTYSIPDHFSFSQLKDYERCPVEYKLKYILKIPMRGKAVFSFGSTIHSTIQEFVKLKGKKDLKTLQKIYKDNWIDEWYEDKKQKEEYYGQGTKIIESFYKDFEKNPPHVLALKDRLALELPFNFKIGQDTITGKIDRIDEINSNLHIYDYKTGKAKDKLTSADKEQLLIYQMATDAVLKTPVKNLTYYYLGEGKKVSFLGTKSEIEKLKNKITQTINKIKNNEFTIPEGHRCEYCDFELK